MAIIKISTLVKAEISIVFNLSRSIDLHKLSTQHTNETAIAGVTTGLIGNGETVTWRAKHFGVYQNLTSKITTFNAPTYFVDEMVSGAFKSFRHEHYFKTINQTTEMVDVFEFQSPFWIFGRFANFLFLKSYMKHLLETRNTVIKEVAESGQWKLLKGM